MNHAGIETQVVRVLIDHLKNRMIQILVAPKSGDLSLSLIRGPSQAIAQSIQRIVALLVAGEAAQPRIVQGVAQRQGSRQLRIGAHGGEPQSILQLIRNAITHISHHAIGLLRGVLTVTVLDEVREAGVVVGRPRRKPTADLPPQITEGTQFETGLKWTGVPARRAHEIHRPSQRGTAIAQGIGAAPHLDVPGRQGLDGLHVDAAVGQIQRDTILKDLQAATMEGALKAGTANGNARLLRAKPRLNVDPRREVESITQGGGAALAHRRAIDKGCATGDSGQLRRGSAHRRHGESGFRHTLHHNFGQGFGLRGLEDRSPQECGNTGRN